ncbi:MAG TPA: dCTP deaminase [Sedimentisphaerales bacterium]|nr:dCTP deaminase [Sedimentisphaerales bacterium]
MILSNDEIHKAIDAGRLIIDPEPMPRIKAVGVKYCPYDAHTVDLRLGPEITIPKSGAFSYDFMNTGDIASCIARNCEKEQLSTNRPYYLRKGNFILAKTLERVAFPVDKGPPYLAGRIEGKSSRARCGLLVHFTAPTVHPEWDGPLTLEMINLCETPFLLFAGMPIAQLIIEQVDGVVHSNVSQFQGQNTPEGLKA